MVEPYHLKNPGYNLRIYIGDEDELVPMGKQVYELTYQAYGLMRYSEKFDELYWNVTGNNWEFPIEKATAKVSLPWQQNDQETFYSYLGAYVGETGSKDAKNAIIYNDNSAVYYDANEMLAPGEGLTIVLGFPTGRIAKLSPELLEVSPMTKLLNSLDAQERINIMSITAILILLYFAIIWWFKGRDPKPGTIIPQYEAPEGLSPAEVAHIHKLGLGLNENLGAGIISLAVKRKIKIIKKEGLFKLGNWEIERLTKDGNGLSEDELLLFSNLFNDDNNKITVPNHDSSLSMFLNWQYKPFFIKKWNKEAYVTNTIWLIIGVLLSVALLFIYFIFGFGGLMLNWLFVFFPILIIILLISNGVKNLAQKGFNFSTIISAIVTLVFILFIAWIFLGSIFNSDWLGLLKSNYWCMLFLTAILLVNIFAFKFIRRPTIHGRKLLDEIEGFKLFLVTTEKDRMDFFHPIDKTPEVFEKYFPYAIALGVAGKWTERFKDLFTPDASGHVAYAPVWYSGALSGINGMSDVSSIGSSLGSSLASSGANGGGGSGGGGGGGGGGGW